MEQNEADTAASRTDRRRLFADLVSSGRFCRDTTVGGILHRGSVSLREISDGDSLHVCVDDDDRLSVHVDHFSPVAGANPDGTCRYSLNAIVAHLTAHVRDQVRRAVRGARGQHRCRLQCEMVDVSEDEAATAVDGAADAPRAPDCSDAAGYGRGVGVERTVANHGGHHAMPDPVLPNPSGSGPLPGGEAAPLLPGSQPPPDVPPSDADVEDPSPGDPPAILGGADPA